MKTVLLTTFAIALLLTAARAQVVEKTVLKAGEDLQTRSFYLFPSFAEATVSLSEGKLVSKMNFNLLTCEMQFINPRGDTLNLAQPTAVSDITFDSCKFFYDTRDGYYQVLKGKPPVQLMVQRKASYRPLKTGAFGLTSQNGGGIDTYETLYAPNGERRLSLDEDVEINRRTTYYLYRQNGDKIKANKDGFVAFFPKKTKQIEAIIRTNNTNFNKENDLKKLLELCED